ncbi:MAG: hypothetical protein JWQ38_1616 [Flavipsychrobacter sp.]|nr:hypothetical protein [Flavipsychrobacter sp.]
MKENHYLVPTQHEGLEKNIEHHVTARSQEDAEDWFVDAKERLLDVNNWKRYATTVSAEFRLTDAHGKAVSRHAHKGDHIRIDIPGPGPEAGGGFDWVQIEAIEYDDYPDIDMETLALRVRPSENPMDKKHEETAHFFSSDATSTIVIERRATQLSARYYGRNEVANMDAGIIDKVRNLAVAAGAWLGMSDAQWGSLMKGLLE